MRVRLKTAIFQSGRSQRQIGADAQVPENRFSQIVRGWRAPTADEAKRIATALDCDEQELFPDEATLADAMSAVRRLDAEFQRQITEAASALERDSLCITKIRAKRILSALPDAAIAATCETMLQQLTSDEGLSI